MDSTSSKVRIISGKSLDSIYGIGTTAEHICSWAGLCPGNNESAGKRNTYLSAWHMIAQTKKA
ncbi:transposase [Enterocloster clostridioformis]